MTPPAPRGRTVAIVLGVITAAALAVRLLGLDAESLWYDEAISLDRSRLGFGALLADRSPLGLDGKPPLYFLLLRAWTEVFGRSPTALRALSVVPGTLVVPLLFLVAARWRGAVAGLLAAGLAAGSPFLVRYSQEARDYSFLFFFATASFLCLDRARERPTPSRIAAWSATLALCLWTSVYGISVFATQALYVAGLGLVALRGKGEGRPRLRDALPIVAGLVGAVALFAPWISVLVQRASKAAASFWLKEPGLEGPWRAIEAFAGTHGPLVVIGPLVLLGTWREAFAPSADRRRGALLLAWLLGPLLLPWIASYVAFPVFIQRGTIIAVGGFVVLAASGIDGLRTSRVPFWTATVLAGAALALGVGRLYDRTDKEDWRGAARHLSHRAAAGDVILVGNRVEAVALHAYAPLDDLVLDAHSAAILDDGALLARRPRVWLVAGHVLKAVREARDGLVRLGFSRVEVTSVYRISLERWER